jgi:hypothetical protein
MQRSLNEIALSTGTDKSDRHHGYIRLYEQYFADRRHDALTLLEIGVAHGASLRMWQEFLPKARIYGLDRNPNCTVFSGNRIEVFIGDQSDPQFLGDVIDRIGALDIVIDDGSHVGEHQIESFESLFPAVREGGLYVVEDLHTSYWGWGTRSAILYFKGLVDVVMINGKSDCGEILNDPNYDQLYAQLGHLQRSVESIHFHRSIIFIRKRSGGHPRDSKKQTSPLRCLQCGKG